jgi:hypothetical protein
MNPPRPILSLTVGITGHRALAAEDAAALHDALAALLARLAAKVAALASLHDDLFAACPPMLALISPLADGADQIAAELALDQGWTLRAMLPFALADYAGDFDGVGRTRLDALIARADAVWTAPTMRNAGISGGDGYALAGQATVAHADLLVAAWDGAPARGSGGTGDVVDLALRRGVPVVHLPIRGCEDEATILWSGFDELRAERPHLEAPRRPLAGPALEDVLDVLIAPPPAPQARALSLFMVERERRLRTRPEWPLLLALIGVQRLGGASFRARPYEAAALADWADYRAAADQVCGPVAGIDALERAFAWADGLAAHYANAYRSGMVLNFAGAALAVLLSLMSWLLPERKLPLLILELTVIAAVIVNTAQGTVREWHRRWLDYRFLAEQLRPLKSLKLMGTASPPVRIRAAEHRWTDWYALAVWRAMGPPPTIADTASLRQLTLHLADHELDTQIAYHAVAARRMHVLDHRLHRIGLALFLATIVVGATMLVALLTGSREIKGFLPVLAVLSTAFPTLGGAIFGIRGAGDFAGAAGRSAETAQRLRRIVESLRRDDVDRGTAARAVEEASAIMLADLAEWRTSYAYRKLAIPS